MRRAAGRMYLRASAMGDAGKMGETRSWDHEADIVVVGSGAAALAAALTVSVGGARVVILEKSLVLGGTTAMSGAGTWIPANHHMLAAGGFEWEDERRSKFLPAETGLIGAEGAETRDGYVKAGTARGAVVEADT